MEAGSLYAGESLDMGSSQQKDHGECMSFGAEPAKVQAPVKNTSNTRPTSYSFGRKSFDIVDDGTGEPVIQ